MKYPYTSIKVIEDKIKAVVNRQTEPISCFDLEEWHQNHEVFEFANPHEEGKIMRCIGGMNPLITYGLEVTCIEIKDGLAWFKEETKENFIYSIAKEFYRLGKYSRYESDTHFTDIYEETIKLLKSHENEQ